MRASSDGRATIEIGRHYLGVVSEMSNPDPIDNPMAEYMNEILSPMATIGYHGPFIPTAVASALQVIMGVILVQLSNGETDLIVIVSENHQSRPKATQSLYWP